jgi:hypothetical protein
VARGSRAPTQRSAQLLRSGALRSRGRNIARCSYGPSSAKQHFVLRTTVSGAVILRCSPPWRRASKDGPQAPAAILRDARKSALLKMTAAMRPACAPTARCARYNHFFHLKNMYGPTAASSIMISAIG